MNPIEILHKYLDPNDALFETVYTHSRSVADMALRLLDRHPELNADRRFVEEAALLHDIGVVMTDAPSIHCYGKEPYICHGFLGAEILRREGYERHALVCERHTGSGLTIKEIESQNLPVPHRDMSPKSIEEQLICFADKFYSKTHLDRERTPEQARKKLEPFGQDTLDRFDKWCESFL